MDFTLNRLKTLHNELKKLIVKRTVEIDGFSYCECGYHNIGAIPKGKDLIPYNGQIWGRPRGRHAWFIKHVILPEDFNPEQCEIFITTCAEGWFFGNPQFIVYIDGKIKQGLDWQHFNFDMDGKREFDLALYGYIGEYIAGGSESECFVPGEVTFKATLIEKDLITEKLYYDVTVPLKALDEINESAPEYFDILNALNEVFNIIDFRRAYSKEYYASVKRAQQFTDGFYARQKATGGPLVTLVGQTHIDVAWLWTKRQVREKAIRSFATALDLLDKYPEYKFMQSQPVLYEYVKHDAPELYARIKEMVKKGRWEVEGGLWVEADCNLLSGESMVRQLLFGKTFIKDEFGVDSKVAWLPDTFGFSGSLPQIFKKAGIEKFVTSKLTWNEVNTLPYDSFNWKGIDGSKIFGYFLTAQDFHRGAKPDRLTIYNARLTVTQVFGAVERYNPKRFNNDVILTYGFGDGGGGPTAEYLEVMQRLNRGINGIPRTESGTLGGFLDKLYDKLAFDKHTPQWTGEFYFEHHRGTYTSIAKIKRNNRKAEFALMNAEGESVILDLLCGAPYPQKAINACWKKVLTNHFHDVLPGSSISEVYDETDVEYVEVFDSLDAVYEDFTEKLSENFAEDKFIVFNPNGALNKAYVLYDGNYYKVENLPAKGYLAVDQLSFDGSVTVDDHCIENGLIKVVFDNNYEISSIYDKRTDKELIKGGKTANALIVFEDYPNGCDAWELQRYYTEKSWRLNNVESVEKICEGARKGVIIKRRYLDSVITQKITLLDDCERIDFDTQMDWNEEHAVLKAEFPLDINFNKTTADVQFGSIERSACANTSWDEARFELFAHKYVDASDGDYGVSLINDCKYGYDVLGGTLRLTILKNASFPYKGGDSGRHEFSYAIFPHQGTNLVDTVKEAYVFNNPVTVFKGVGKRNKLTESYSLVSADKENIIVETVKKAEIGSDVIVRAYDCKNTLTRVFLKFGFDVKEAFLCDLMENELERVNIENGGVYLIVKPFEIVSLKLKR